MGSSDKSGHNVRYHAEGGDNARGEPPLNNPTYLLGHHAEEDDHVAVVAPPEKPLRRPTTPFTLSNGSELTNQNHVEGINDLTAALEGAAKAKERRISADMTGAENREGGLFQERFLR